jgi:arsenate reductase
MRYVLFVCVQNAGRSQMAQALFEQSAPEDLRAESAGSEPAARVHPQVVEVMQELGIDISGRRPKKLGVEMQLHADWAVTMGCGDVCPYVPTRVEDWEIPDPAGEPIERVREIRDLIAARVERLIAERAEEIRADRTAHTMRLEALIPGLVEEFEGSRDAEQIRACADAVLSDYDAVALRSHVLTLAQRRTRECLQADSCYELKG